MNLKVALLALLIALPAQAGTLAEHAGVYRAAAENSSFCPQDTVLALKVSDDEQSFSVEYTGPGTVNGVPVEGVRDYELNVVVPLLRMPISYSGRMVLKNNDVIVQEKSALSFFWKDTDTLFGLKERNSVTAFFATAPCLFVR